MNTEIQKLKKQIRQLKRELLLSEKQVDKLTLDNKRARNRIIKFEEELETCYSDIRSLEEDSAEWNIHRG